MYKKIVVGTDGSTTAAQAVDHAAGLAKSFDAELHVVSVHKPLTQLASLEMASLAGVIQESDQAVRQELQRLLDELGARLEGHGVKVVTQMGAGDPADVLCDAGADADLIVLGSRGMTGVKRLLGSVPNKVSHQAPCSVLIVHTG